MRIENFRSGEALGSEARIVFFTSGTSFGRVARTTPVPAAQDPDRPRSVVLSTAAAAHRRRALAGFAAGALEMVATRLRALADALRRRRAVRATLRALQPLDTRALHDLGLTRSELLSVALDLADDREDRRLRAGRAREYFAFV